DVGEESDDSSVQRETDPSQQCSSSARSTSIDLLLSTGQSTGQLGCCVCQASNSP
ncbi:unnamed protein product, partial [Ceratitis capitata]